jgi:hypothetical protein
MDSTDAPLVQNANALTQVFGYWPSFHDAEILTLYLDRGGEDGPSLEARVHVFEMTDRVDEQGRYILRHHTLVTLRFARVLEVEFSGFNDQNSLWELAFREVEPAEHEGRQLKVFIETNHGLSGSFLCARASVLSVEAYAPAA